ncbi:MAG TPA: hypothetical protein V6C81_12005 [Planktothrix sp.]|jgi:hypothetical protein
MFTSCVLREVAPGDTQYVPVHEVPFLTANEVVYTGTFRRLTEDLGPHGSHRRTICLPVNHRELKQSAPCVLREVNPGDFQYVPATDVPVAKGERMFAAEFELLTGQRCGPYKSHSRTIALPKTRPIEVRAAA